MLITACAVVAAESARFAGRGPVPSRGHACATRKMVGWSQCFGAFAIKQATMLHLHMSLWNRTLDKGLFGSMPADHLIPVWWASPAKHPALLHTVLLARGRVPDIVYEHVHTQRTEDASEPSASDADKADSNDVPGLTLPSSCKRRQFVRHHFGAQEVYCSPMDIYRMM